MNQGSCVKSVILDNIEQKRPVSSSVSLGVLTGVRLMSSAWYSHNSTLVLFYVNGEVVRMPQRGLACGGTLQCCFCHFRESSNFLFLAI